MVGVPDKSGNVLHSRCIKEYTLPEYRENGMCLLYKNKRRIEYAG